MEQNISEKKSNRTKWLILLTVIIGTFLGRLDQTVVNLAVPKIIQNFGITVSTAGWIATAYIIANAIFVPVWGKLGDMIGRKKVYLVGFIIFIFGSVLAGLSWNFSSLIVFRLIQAVAVSADYPTAMAILAMTFTEGKERAQALGIWSASFAAAAVFGPLIGGPLIDNFGWPSVFYVNLPIGILGIFMALTFIRESRVAKKIYHFDWWGAIVLGISLAALVLVLDKGVEWGWTSWQSVLMYFVTILASAIFIYIERKSQEPIVDLKFFKKQVFVNTLANNFIVFMGFIGVIFVVPVFAQLFLHYDATQTGYLFIPLAFTMMIAAPLGGRLIGRVQPRYVIIASTGVAAIGLFVFSILIDAKATALDIIIPLTIMAFGLGFGMAQRTNIISVTVPKEEIGSASSVLALVRNIAGAFGIAIFNTILTDSTQNGVLQLSKFSFIKTTNPIFVNQFIALIELKAQILGFKEIFIVSSIVVLVGAIYAFWIRIPKTEEIKTVVVE